MKNRLKLISALLIGAWSYYTPAASAHTESANVSQVGRYTTVVNEANSSQTDLLSQVIQIRFPQNVQTVGEAMEYILRFSGYSLVATSRMNGALKIILSKPLPVVDRELGPLSLRKSLITLTGSVFILIQDPINRTVDFQLKPGIAKMVTSNKYLSNVEGRA